MHNGASSSNGRTSSTPGTSSNLRPRQRRLISGLSEEGDELVAPSSSAGGTRAASPLPSPWTSRTGSPIPSERLSRPGSSKGRPAGTGTWSPSTKNLGTGVRGLGAGDTSPSLSSLWGSSWTTLQGLATDLLSGDAQDPQGKPRTRRPLSRLQATPRSSTSAPPREWGPTSAPSVQSVGAGSREERENALRAQKRKDMLLRREPSYADTLGRFKRRTSDEDRGAASAPPGEDQDRDALVYLHHVRKEDTMAGITIRYNCSANTLRKANRMWPNDTVQSRPIIVLPVDACGSKGKRVSGPEAMDMLGDDTEALSAGQAEEVDPLTPTMNGGAFAHNRTNSASTNTSNRRPSSAAVSSVDTEPLWHHDSWVLLPGATKPTEIARLSRRSLGYFPPARRKSNSYSDLDTPSTSLDLARTPTSELMNHPALSPMRQDAPQRPRRTRKLSNASNGYFPSYLAGPGGVGTMSKSVASPGPAQDPLNKMFAKHLPDVAPPRNQQSLYQPEMPLYTDAQTTPLGSGANTPNAMANMNVNLENVGGAIEGWMRRVAAKAKDAMDPAERRTAARASVGTPGRGVGGIGDLIEMTDEFEIGDDEAEEGERGRQGSQDVLGSNAASSTSFAAAGAGGGSRQRSRGDYFGKAAKSD